MGLNKQISSDNCFESLIVPYKDIEVLSRIGSGGFGTIEKVRHVKWGDFAFKQLKEDTISEFNGNKLKKEANVHLQLNHPNIIRLIGIVFEPGQYGLLLEYAPNGHMLQYLHSISNRENNSYALDALENSISDLNVDGGVQVLSGAKLTERTLELVHDVSVGMTYLHTQQPHPVVHGDLKIENILIGIDLKAKVCDFGLSEWKDYSSMLSRSKGGKVLCGSITNIPPEAWREPQTKKSLAYDLYGFAILVYTSFFLENPLPIYNEYLVKHYAVNGIRPDINKLPNDVPERCKKVIIGCWADLPENRPKFADVQRDLRFSLNDHRCFQMYSDMKPLTEIKVNNRIKGISILKDILYILCENSLLIEAFSLRDPFGGIRNKEFRLPSMLRPMDMTPSDLLDRLFISDKSEQNIVWAYDVSRDRASFAKFPASPYRLTATKGRDELIVVCERREDEWEVVIVQASNFSSLRTIQLPEYVKRPELVIRNTNNESESDTFMMFYQTTDTFRESKFDICEISLAGLVLRTFDILQLNTPHLNLTEWWPQYMAVDQRGDLILCDRYNENLLLVSRQLDNYGLIADASKGLVCPIRLCIDEQLRCLATAQYTQVGGLVAIFTF